MTDKERPSIFLSIIVPVFNGEKTLDKCLEAITKIKDFEKCELIVANDASVDTSVLIAKKHGVKVVSNPVNKGVAATRNLGAKNAKGEILLFVDSDIVLSSRDIIKHIKDDFKSFDVCGVSGVYDERIVFSDFFSTYKHLYMCLGKKIASKFNFAADSAILAIPREMFFKANGFNENYLGATAEDIEFTLRLSLNENKKILQDNRIKGEHHKKHNLKSLLRTNCLRIGSIVRIIQEKELRKTYLNMSKSSSGKSLYPIILASIFLILSFIYWFFIFGFLFSVLMFFWVQTEFFKYFKRRKGVFFAVLSVLFSAIEMFFAAVCGLYFQIYFKIKN
ncbi:MAG: glycosyltransferase [Nitrospinae bacterium]|nr:glycosyltransferase [Patescibacteria group bacterium]MBU4321553.1 glycosyltransferase [Nitrospinota bacterium]